MSRLDKASYKPGEEMRLRIASRFAGTATIAIVSESLNTLTTLDVKEGDTVKSLPVSADWGAGAYAVVLGLSPARQGRPSHAGPGDRACLVCHRSEAHGLDVKLSIRRRRRGRAAP